MGANGQWAARAARVGGGLILAGLTLLVAWASGYESGWWSRIENERSGYGFLDERLIDR